MEFVVQNFNHIRQAITSCIDFTVRFSSFITSCIDFTVSWSSLITIDSTNTIVAITNRNMLRQNQSF